MAPLFRVSCQRSSCWAAANRAARSATLASTSALIGLLWGFRGLGSLLLPFLAAGIAVRATENLAAPGASISFAHEPSSVVRDAWLLSAQLEHALELVG